MKKNLNTKVSYTIVTEFCTFEGNDDIQITTVEGKLMDMLSRMAEEQKNLTSEGYSINVYTKNGSVRTIGFTASLKTESGYKNQSRMIEIA